MNVATTGFRFLKDNGFFALIMFGYDLALLDQN